MSIASCRMILLLTIAMLLSACQSKDGRASEPLAPVATDHQPSVSCPDERPAACTPDYQPVCGFIDTGVRCVTTPCPSWETYTFSNGCSACTDERVAGFSDGICPQDVGTAPAETEPATDTP